MLKRRHLFGTTILTGLLVAASAQAQTQSSNDTRPQSNEATTQVEEVVVTGSRIKRPQYEGVIPGVQVSSQDISERLFTNAGDILNDIPLVGGGASLSGTNGGQTASLGVTYIDLLNLGTARTLTLVNGRRFVSNNSATIFVAGNETGSQVDASSIPVALIDRVDILTVGGAAAYGADAVSGVVNYVLKDDYEGAEITITGGQTFEYEDAGRVAVNGVWGKNFLDGRLNVAISGEYSKIDALLGSERDFRSDNPGLISNWMNGGVRNSAFVPGGTGAAATAFLPTTADGITPSLFRRNLRTNSTWFGGAIFNPVLSNGAAENPAIANLATGSSLPVGPAFFQPGNVFRNPGYAQISPFQYSFINGGTLQMVPGVPFGACIASASDVCAFAPASMTAAQTTAARTRFNLPASYTAAQVLAVVQANRPTAREYFAANPTIDINNFLGTFLPGLPDVANTDSYSAVLARKAVPIRFDSNGNIVRWDFAGALAGDPSQPGTFATSVNGEGQNRQDTAVLRIQQERSVGNVLANYQITDNIRFFTENLYSDATVINPISTGGLFNGVTSSSPENAGILVNVNHPFLTDANRASLAQAGITGNFILSRNNEDIVNDLSQRSTMETFRTVNGFDGTFDLFGRSFGWELSHTYGKAETHVEFSAINDVAFALAIDAVNDNGVLKCRVQRDGLANYLASFGGANNKAIPGAIPQPISQIGADGVREQVIFTPTVTQDMANACQPLNIFGEGRASQAARDFVSVRNFFNNESTQNFTQAVLTGDIITLPAGPLQFALTGELRKEELSYTVDEITRQGRTRSAPSATTNAEVETREGGIELRIPVFGGDYQLPFVKSLEFNPSVRYTRQKGSAEKYRNLSGVLTAPTYSGETEEVYTLAATWEVNDQLLFRGNISKSVRNPSIVELFLGNQAFFTSSADPCSPVNIAGGPAGGVRRSNCRAEVLRVAAANSGVLLQANGTAVQVTNAAEADAFLALYQPSGASFTGVISGRQTLQPEKGDSFTFGFVARPKVIPNLIVAADYLEITVTDALGPLLAQSAAVYCYDSSAYPDNTPDIGVNSCAGIQRDGAFNFTNGFELPFFNLGGTRVKAINANMSYSMDLADVFTADADLGTLGFRANAYYLLEYSSSGIGDFSDSIASENSLGNPTWKTQFNVLYNLGRFNARWSTSFQDASIVRGTGSLQATFEQTPVVRYDGYMTHSLSLGYDVTDKASARIVIDNVTDEDTLGYNGLQNGVYIDNIGRRWTASLSYRF
ncbi:TonB-dependent receptor [Brevundimonas pondensis]|uniref:TonB-dependent receptor domain-containing protein n=1 Tax=Brevundimonas pondensis TaxID=2774189 RepID=UPI00320B3593